MKKHTNLLLILLIAAFLRFYQIDSNPKSMYGDGMTAVYDAWSIFKTGHDQKGNFMPLVFSLGGGRPGGYIYATVPFAAIFGPTALAGQMVSVLSGIGIVLLLYLLAKRLLPQNAALVIAALAAVNPWSLSLSRGPFESHFALFLTFLGIYSFIRGGFWLLIMALSFGLASQTYGTYRFTIPLLALLLFLWNKKDIKKPLFVISLIIVALSTFLSVYLTVSRGREDRFDIINIFKDPNLRSAISQKVKNERLLDSLSPSFSHLIHTPQIELAGIWAENYIDNFLPDFLFIHGDGQVRHNPAEMGGFFWIDAILLVFGIIYLYKNEKKLLLLLSGWIAIAPTATSLVGGAHALRSSLLLPPLLILSGVGLWNLLQKRRYPLLLTLLGVLFAIQFFYFIDRFYFVAPKKNARFWSYPAKEAAILALKNYQKFDYVILSNDIDNMEFAYPVYAKLEPKEVIAQNQNPTNLGEYKFFKYGNIFIGSLPNTRVWEFIKDLPGRVLYIGSAKEEKFLENYNIIRGFDSQPDLVITAKSGIPDLDLKDL